MTTPTDERPVGTGRTCTVCTAGVAAYKDAMCCHCMTVPWILDPDTRSLEPEAADRGVSEAEVELVARAIWTAPITGQPVGEEVRPWPPRNSDAMIETMNQARAAIQSLRSNEETGK